MLKSKSKRLAELERRLAATHERVKEQLLDAIWAHVKLSPEEEAAYTASLERQMQPGYVLTAEEKALEQRIEQRWPEAVKAVVPEDQLVLAHWREWAVQWGKVANRFLLM